MEPSIFTVASVPAIGELGPATEVEESEVCPMCNRHPAPEFTSVEFVFDAWDGEDLVMALGVHAASERLRDAIERAGLTGARFEDIKVSRAEYFELGEDAYADDLPRFYRLEFTGRARGPEIWWRSTYCEECGLRSWEQTPEGTRAEMAIAFGNPAPPRQVYRSSWSRDDLFRFEDHGSPLVTERAKDVFESVPVKEVTFQPAEWVDD
jgi:hypothetical protein